MAQTSPTGRTPKLLWTPARQEVWSRMVSEHHPWWEYIHNAATAEGTSGQHYGDNGQFGVLAYQMTGDAAYARRAYTAASKSGLLVTTPPDANTVREFFGELVWMYDWLYPALTPSERKDWIDVLNGWCNWSLSVDTKPYQGGFRTSDSDQTIGQYFGLAFVDLATGPDNPKAGTYLKQTFPDAGGRVKPVGGLTATGADLNTARNTLALYAKMAAGGAWFESSEYNNGTPVLWMMGIEGVLTATGREYFPELRALIPQVAIQSIHDLTPDLAQPFQWGDDEHPRDLLGQTRVALLGVLAGLTQKDPDTGPYIQRFVSDLQQRAGSSADPYHRLMLPFARFFLFYNPYAPAADWRTGISRTWYSSGQGILRARTGTGPMVSAFSAHCPTRTYCDHETVFQGDFQLYRKGEWVLTHPVGYTPITDGCLGTNGLLLSGLSTMVHRGPVAHEIAADGSHCYLAGSTSGPYYDQPYYDPPPAFVREWTRSILYIPSANSQVDTIVIYDRVHAADPKALPNFNRYRPDAHRDIAEAPHRKQWIIHAPVAPDIAPDSLSWRTPGGQSVKISTHLPAKQVRSTFNESQLWDDSSRIQPPERKFHVRISPAVDHAWDTFLNVALVFDGGIAPTTTLVQSPGGEVQGVHIRRSGLNDLLVLFGAKESMRILVAGFTVNWEAVANSTDVYLADLETTLKWSASLDGGTIPLTVSNAGMGRLTFSGAGMHTLSLSAGKV